MYFDSFSYVVASIVFGDMAIVSLFLPLFFFFSQSQILSGNVQARHRGSLGGLGKKIVGNFHVSLHEEE